MKKSLFSFSFFLLCFCMLAENPNTFTISGRVTDFKGNPIDNSAVVLMRENFNPASIVMTDATGHYSMEVEKGQYLALLAMRLNEHPASMELFGIPRVSDENLRLEFWAWNVIVDRDLTINPRYDRLELYGFQVFEVLGASPHLFAYVRPMSVGKYIETRNMDDISVDPKNIEFEIFSGEEELTIRSVQSIYEYHEEGKSSTAFIIQFDKPSVVGASYNIFRIIATHNAFGGEMGENWYFRKRVNYK